MSITINQRKLARAVDRIYLLREKKSTMPILEHFLLRLADGGKVLEMFATNLEAIGRVTVPLDTVQGELPGLAVEAVKLKKAVQALTANKSLTLERVTRKEKDHSGISREVVSLIVSGLETSTAYVLATTSPDEFPTVKMADAPPTTMPAKDLLEALRVTSYAVSDDETRYNLNGLFFEKARDGGTFIVASDGHRMAATRVQNEIAAQDVIVPKSAIGPLAKVLAKESGEVIIRADEKRIGFEAGGLQLSTTGLDGRFPDWRQIVPYLTGGGFTVDGEKLVASIKRVTALSSDSHVPVIVKVTPDKASVEVTARDAKATEPIDVVSAESYDFALRNTYFAEAIKKLGPGMMRIAPGKKNLAAIRISREDETDGAFAVVMPGRA
ncbi:hypothetical protein LCGC14_1296790 [marine sediment metagenome]|uniref:DNA polymerase III beta sliding clamp central domain-containing protein n=1 Tax=marine sediment metagenome TaxID=412755 RepID=A0A0F9LBF3_9ZZZZ